MRESRFIDEAKFLDGTFREINEFCFHENNSALSTDYCIEFYRVKEGCLERYKVINEDKSEVIRLYKKVMPTGNHYDLIALM